MKGIFKNKAQKAFLTAAISLALTGSVFAMPVLDKNQTPSTVTIGDLTSKTGTVDVTGLGLVDWQSLNIANGETLKFILNDDNANIINRVTGSDMSQIYGHMLSQGEGGVCLVNPNGILIGNGAQIDVGSLVLSTANFTENDPAKILSVLKDGGSLTLQTEAGKGKIELAKGSTVNYYDTLWLVGGPVWIADNVTISDGLKRLSVDGQHIIEDDGTVKSDLGIYAIDQGTATFNKDCDLKTWQFAAGGTILDLQGAKLNTGNANFVGGAVNLTNTQLTSQGSVYLYGLKDGTVNTEDGRGAITPFTTYPKSWVSITDSKLNAKGSIYTRGGFVSINNTADNGMSTPQDIFIEACNSGSLTDPKATYNSVSIKGGHYDAMLVEVKAGKITLDDVTAKATETLGLDAQSYIGQEADRSISYATAGMDTVVKDSTLTGGAIRVTGNTVTIDGATTLQATDMAMVLAAGSEIHQVWASPNFYYEAKGDTHVSLGKNVQLKGNYQIVPGEVQYIDEPTTPTDPSTPTEPTTPTTPTQPSDPGTTPSAPVVPVDADAAQVAEAIQQGQTLAAKRAVVRGSEPMAEGAELARQKQSEEAGMERVERMPRPQADAVVAAGALPVAADTTANVTVDGTAED